MENLNFNGYGENVVTILAEDGIKKGYVVKIVDNNKVGVCGEGDYFFGIVVNMRDNYAAVQTKGYCKVKKSGTIPLGYHELMAYSEDAIKCMDAGIPCQVIAVDDTYAEIIML